MMTRIAPLFLAGVISVHAADYHVLGKIPVGGDGGWDYLVADSDSRRLYVSHATHVVVVDMDAQKVVGDIPDTPGVHGIALDRGLNRGWVSNGRANNVTVFDTKTLKKTGEVATGQNPDAIVYDPKSDSVFVFNGRSNDATVIQAADNSVKATIPLGGKPEFPAIDGKGKLWVNIEDTHEIAEIDTVRGAISKRYTLEGCEDPTGLAVDLAKGRLFSVCRNKVMIVSDPAAGKVVASVPIGAGTDGAAFDPARKLAFSSNADGTLSIVGEKGGKYVAVSTVQTQQGARNIAVDLKTHKLYLPVAEFGPAPQPVAGQPRPRPAMVPNSFSILVVGQ